VRLALSEKNGSTVLVDVGDNLGAGTPGDGTVILTELIRQTARDALVLVCDPETVAEAVKTGVRGRARFTVGAKIDQHHGTPVEIEATVRTLSDGIFKNIGPMRDGVVDDQGRTAVLEADGILIVATERRMPMWNLEQLPIAHRIIEVDTPGLAAADVRRFAFKNLRRPIYPLDSL
jgi:microcystin degradation protein MlrC